METVSGLWTLLIGLLWTMLVTSSPVCDIGHVYQCLVAFNRTYPIVNNVEPARLETLCREQGLPADDCLTNFRFACYPDERSFVDNVLHALSDMCSMSTLQEYRSYRPCLSTSETQRGLRECQVTHHSRSTHCRLVEDIIRCERGVVQVSCGAEVGAWYVLWSLQARTTLDGTSKLECDVNLSSATVPPAGTIQLLGPLAIVLIVTGVALMVVALFVCAVYTVVCGRREYEPEETDMLNPVQPPSPSSRQILEVY